MIKANILFILTNIHDTHIIRMPGKEEIIMDIKDFANKFIEVEKQAFKEGNYKALEAIEAPDVVYHWGGSRDMVGHEAHKQDIINYREKTSKHLQEWNYVVGDGNICVLSIKETITFIKDYPVIRAQAGTTVEFDAFFVLRRENDRVAEAWIKGNPTVIELET